MTKHEIINWKTATHNAWTRNIIDTGLNVFGVLRFDNGRHIAQDRAQHLWTNYWHKIDRIFFGHAAAKGFGVERRCFIELGSDGRNLHMHFAALSPIAVEPFCAVANAVWVNLHKRTEGYERNWIMPLLFGEDGAAYTAKSTKKLSLDDAGLRYHWCNRDAQQTLGFNIQTQTRRIQNAVDSADFEQAHEWLKAHIIQAEHNRQARQARKAQAAQQAQ